jgi:hypothetical protein
MQIDKQQQQNKNGYTLPFYVHADAGSMLDTYQDINVRRPTQLSMNGT